MAAEFSFTMHNSSVLILFSLFLFFAVNEVGDIVEYNAVVGVDELDTLQSIDAVCEVHANLRKYSLFEDVMFSEQ